MPNASPAFRPLRDDVRDAIRERIITGVHAPGSRLVERAIAADLGVSRIPVREALQALVSEGFAVDRATRGIAVRAYDDAEIAELADVGAALESVLVGSMPLHTDALTRLRAVLDEAETALDAGDLTAAVAANGRFHEVLAALGEGTIAHEVFATVAERRRWLLAQHSDPGPILAEHVELYDALVAGDRAKARAITEKHARTTVAHALRTREQQ